MVNSGRVIIEEGEQEHMHQAINTNTPGFGPRRPHWGAALLPQELKLTGIVMSYYSFWKL